jgi:hypothetical protein
MIWGPAGAERMGKALPTSQNGEREGDLRARRHQDRTSIAHRSRRGTANAIRRRDPARAAGELPEDHRQSRGSVSPFSAWDKFFPCFEVAPPISDRRPSRSHPGRCSPLARTAVNPSAVHSAGSMAGIATAAAATCGRSRPTPSGGRLMGRSLPRKQWEGLDHWDSQRSEAAREIRGTAAGGGGGPRLASAARPRPPWSPCRARGGTWSPHRLAIMALAAPTGAWAVSGGQALVGLMGRTGGARTAVEAWSSTLCPGLGRGDVLLAVLGREDGALGPGAALSGRHGAAGWPAGVSPGAWWLSGVARRCRLRDGRLHCPWQWGPLPSLDLLTGLGERCARSAKEPHDGLTPAQRVARQPGWGQADAEARGREALSATSSQGPGGDRGGYAEICARPLESFLAQEAA